MDWYNVLVTNSKPSESLYADNYSHPNRQFIEIIYAYIFIELKTGETTDCKMGKYCWLTSCPKATGGVPS